MKYELDVLAALSQLPQPTTQEIVAATGISERKVQSVIKDLQSDLKVGIDKIKKGRSVYYLVTDWGVFETAGLLKRTLATRPINKIKKLGARGKKAAFYDSVKMSNYKESSRLEGISIQTEITSSDKKSIINTKQSLIEKYSKFKTMSIQHG